MIQISVGGAISLIVAFLTCVFAFGRILLGQFEKRMSERFQAQDQAREIQLKTITERQRDGDARVAGLVDKFDRLTRELPLAYVRREDHIRFSAVIDHKLDRLAELVMQLMRGDNNARS